MTDTWESLPQAGIPHHTALCFLWKKKSVNIRLTEDDEDLKMSDSQEGNMSKILMDT